MADVRLDYPSYPRGPKIARGRDGIGPDVAACPHGSMSRLAAVRQMMAMTRVWPQAAGQPHDRCREQPPGRGPAGADPSPRAPDEATQRRDAGDECARQRRDRCRSHDFHPCPAVASDNPPVISVFEDRCARYRAQPHGSAPLGSPTILITRNRPSGETIREFGVLEADSVPTRGATGCLYFRYGDTTARQSADRNSLRENEKSRGI